MVKKAVSLAMDSKWAKAIKANQDILDVSPDDLESHNRLGKALAELGRNRKAKAAFKHALKISPHNHIARKNLSRLEQLDDEIPLGQSISQRAPRVFIEESGKTEITSLISLAGPKVLLKLTPGHPIHLNISGNGLDACGPDGQYAGMVEPRIASRLTRLVKGGNRYEAAVTHVGKKELIVMIKEVFKHPSQAASVSFPTRQGSHSITSEYRTSSSRSPLAINEANNETRDGLIAKDWSNDDTEPGDDEVFSPILHSALTPTDPSAEENPQD